MRELDLLITGSTLFDIGDHTGASIQATQHTHRVLPVARTNVLWRRRAVAWRRTIQDTMERALPHFLLHPWSPSSVV